jgi:hypothetical protein
MTNWCGAGARLTCGLFFQSMKPVVQTYVENGMQQMAAEVAERTVLNATNITTNGKKQA